MNPRFNKGDKVVVVDADEGLSIRNGEEYVVESSRESCVPCNGGIIYLVGKEPGYLGHRFELIESSNFVLAEEFDIPVTEPLHITYCGVTITLDTQLQSSRKFAEVLLDLAYGKEFNV